MDKCIQVKLTSYRLVSQELHRTLEQSKVHFESFTEDAESHGQLNAFTDLIEQINGCLRILRLRGVDTLAGEILQLALDFHRVAVDSREQRFTVISSGLIELEQYLEYIDRTESEFPALLLETINRLRKENSKEALPEHYFYNQNQEFVDTVSAQLQALVASPDTIVPPERLRRLRQMYQIGLADYIRETNTSSSLSMMARSLNRTIDQGIPNNYALIFGFAAAAVSAVSESKIEPTRERKQLFAAIDKQFRNLVDNPQQMPKIEHCENLIRGFSYVFLVSGCTAAVIRSLVEKFSIKPLFFTDQDIRREREFLSSPDASASRSLMRAVSTELAAVKDNIELAFKTSELHGTVDFSSLIEPIKELSHIFEMAEMAESVKIMQQILVRIEEWDIQKCILSEDEFSEIADQLTLIENQTFQINKSVTSSPGTASVQLEILQEAQQHVVSETKDGLALTKRGIDSYLDSGGDAMHLLNITALMESVRGGTLFLGLKEVTEILRICQGYIQSNLIESRDPIQSESLETLADVIISVEYYLENMDLNLNSNKKILTLAEDGIKELAA
ncbi:MAG: hypothetical protein P1U80_09155 [Pseudomonadales bacterium]|nr:hypothetical protein [Pseudomonadales bacterium]